MSQLNQKDITEFLKAYPKLILKPLLDSTILFEGRVESKVKYLDYETLDFGYEIRIVIPEEFPNDLPEFFMLEKSIKPNIDLHIESNGKICPGVPLLLMMILRRSSSFYKYTESVLISYLYGLTYKLKNGKFPFREIGHYGPGLIEEYKRMLNLDNKEAIARAFELLGMDRAEAHFKECPCGCNNKYMICTYMNTLEQYRYLADKTWYNEQAKKIRKIYERSDFI